MSGKIKEAQEAEVPADTGAEAFLISVFLFYFEGFTPLFVLSPPL